MSPNGVMMLMDLKTYLSGLTQEARERLAVAAGTTYGHMRNVSYGLRQSSAEMAVAIERETKGVVTRKDLRPDDWHLIWPELIGKKPVKSKSVA